jgi:phage shock protein C
MPGRAAPPMLGVSEKNNDESEQVMEKIRAAFRREGLVRVQDGRVLGGVIAGLGRRVGIEPWPARLLFVVVLMLIPGSQLLVYPLLWVLMPQAEDAKSVTTVEATPTM